MADEPSYRQRIIDGEIVAAWFDRRKEFSRQILSISTLSTAGVVAMSERATDGGAWLLLLSGAAFVLAIAASMVEMYLDSKVLEKVADPKFEGSKTKYDPWVQGLSIASCALIVAGAVLAVCFVMIDLDLWKEIF